MKQRVVVAMSGGVDSSLAATLLKNAGFDVIGIMLKLWSEEGKHSSNKCCSSRAVDDARSVANFIDIPFYVLDYGNFFKEKIVDHFLESYSNALTPNPCFNCNLKIRFGHLLRESLKLKASFLATGHYAMIKSDSYGRLDLAMAKDEAKDQSYMLHRLTQFELKHALFPLGKYTKAEVRALAKSYNLPVFSKKDSQDLCFLGSDGLKGFMSRNLKSSLQKGLITDKTGNVLGEHAGLACYTVGQRKGLNIKSNKIYYVVKLDKLENKLIVATDNERGENEFYAIGFNFTKQAPQDFPFDCKVKLRYKSPLYSARIMELLSNGTARILLDKPVKDITPGQGAVVYKNSLVVGGGTIQTKDYFRS